MKKIIGGFSRDFIKELREGRHWLGGFLEEYDYRMFRIKFHLQKQCPKEAGAKQDGYNLCMNNLKFLLTVKDLRNYLGESFDEDVKVFLENQTKSQVTTKN